MIRVTIFLCFLTICALSAPVPNDEEPTIEKLENSFEPLTEVEKYLLMQMAKDHKDGQTPEDFMLTVKTRSPSIYEKLTKLRNMFEERYNLLNEEAQGFAKNAIAETIAFAKAISNGDKSTMLKIVLKIRSEYDNLSEEAKASFGKHFFLNPVYFSMIPKE